LFLLVLPVGVVVVVVVVVFTFTLTLRGGRLGGLLPAGGGGCDIVVAAAIGIDSWRGNEMMLAVIVIGIGID